MMSVIAVRRNGVHSGQSPHCSDSEFVMKHIKPLECNTGHETRVDRNHPAVLPIIVSEATKRPI
jgi:hypothetical protein